MILLSVNTLLGRPWSVREIDVQGDSFLFSDRRGICRSYNSKRSGVLTADGLSLKRLSDYVDMYRMSGSPSTVRSML